MLTPEFKTSVSLNVINFFFFGGISCIVPFFSVHMHAIGLSSWHTICVHIASGLICILVPLIVGTIAEKRGSSPRKYLYKSCFCLSLFLSILAYTALLALPKIQRIHKQPQVDFDCSSPMNAVINLEKCSNYETCGDVAEAWSDKTQFRLSHCHFKYKDSDDLRPNPPDPNNPLQMCFRSTGNTTHHCLVYDPQVRDNPTLEFTSDLKSWQFTEYRNVSAKAFSFSEVNKFDASPLNICNYVPASSGTVIRVNGRQHDTVTCQRSLTEQVVGIKCVLFMQNEEGMKRPDCFDIVGDLSLTFWSYLGLRCAADAFFLAALCLLEGISLRVIQGGPYNRGAYGRSRMSAAAAMAIFPTLVGMLVDYFTQLAGSPDYTPAYFLMTACELLVCVLIYVLPLPVGGNTFRYDISQAEFSPRTYGEESNRRFGLSLEIIVVSVMATFSGTAWGLSQVFDPLLYQDIGFNNLLLGGMQSMVFLFAIPFLWVAKNLLHNIGEVHLICAAFAFHSLHLAGLSFIKEWSYWWWATPFEAMKAFTIPILWIALVAAAEHENSKGRRIAMQYVMAVLHFGIGRILGCSIGGFIAEKYSMSLSYRAMSGFCLTIAVLYLCFHHCFMKPRHRKIIANRNALQRQSVNGSCLLLVEQVPINGRIVSRNNN